MTQNTFEKYKLIVAERFDKYCFENGISNALALKIINTAIDYSHVRTPAIYAKENNISPQAVYQNRTIRDTKIGKLVI